MPALAPLPPTQSECGGDIRPGESKYSTKGNNHGSANVPQYGMMRLLVNLTASLGLALQSLAGAIAPLPAGESHLACGCCQTAQPKTCCKTESAAPIPAACVCSIQTPGSAASATPVRTHHPLEPLILPRIEIPIQRGLLPQAADSPARSIKPPTVLPDLGRAPPVI